jgi:ribonuclease HII
LLEFETRLWDVGLVHIAGVDEVGRGCLFGDVVAAAVILPARLQLLGVDDSKKLSEKKREISYELVLREAAAWGIGRVDAEHIDRINIKQAARLAMRKAVEQLSIVPEQLLIDAERIDLGIAQTPIIKGDQLSQSIAAASIVAKVTRDRLCLEWDRMYPEYGISIHKGYATKLHRERIKELGPTPLHRQSFLKNIYNEQLELF